MCLLCTEFAPRREAANVSDPYGAIAQLVERFHGMEEVAGSIPASSTTLFGGLCDTLDMVGFTLGGLVAGEGSFIITTKQPPFKDGSPRLRFVFSLSMASRDRALLESLQGALGVGSICDSERRHTSWLPASCFTVNSLKAHQAATIPFFDRYLPPTAKRREYLLWKAALTSFDSLHPHRHGKGPGTCAKPECTDPVRGRGLCRRHYYRATGY